MLYEVITRYQSASTKGATEFDPLELDRFSNMQQLSRALTELGGIHQLGKLNTLFGKPAWFAGVMTQREQQLNVVDTGRWIMPEQDATPDYQYLIMLGDSAWGLACHELMGTEWLSRDQIKWRDKAGVITSYSIHYTKLYESRVSQIHSQAMHRVRARMKDWY